MADGETSDKPTVAVTSEEVSAVVRSLGVEVDASRVNRAFDRAYRDLAKRVRVKGFRPGKTPRSVLERLYGASIGEDIERALVGETLPEALAEAQVIPVAEPSIDATPPAPDAPFRYTARVEVKPEVELPDLEGLEGRRPSTEVGDEDVERELESLRERQAPLVDEPEGTGATQGSTVTLDYVGRIDGEAFEGGSAEGAVVEIGSGRFIPGFEEQLEGATAGEERDLHVEFPADYGSPDVAGKQAVFAVKVTAVRRRELPALDDAFAKSLGDFENMDALKERMVADMTAQRERGARQELRSSEVPAGMVDRRVEQRLAMAHRQLGGSLPEEELHAQIAQWRDQWRPAAEREVREELVLEAVARSEGLAVEDEELDAHIEEQAREQGIAPKRLRERFSDPGMREGLRFDRLAEKALDHLASQAKIDESSGT